MFRGFRRDVSEKFPSTTANSNQKTSNMVTIGMLEQLERKVVLGDPESYIDLGEYRMACLEEEIVQTEKLDRELTEEEIENLKKDVKERFIRKVLSDYGWSYDDYLAGEKVS